MISKARQYLHLPSGICRLYFFYMYIHIYTPNYRLVPCIDNSTVKLVLSYMTYISLCSHFIGIQILILPILRYTVLGFSLHQGLYKQHIHNNLYRIHPFFILKSEWYGPLLITKPLMNVIVHKIQILIKNKP